MNRLTLILGLCFASFVIQGSANAGNYVTPLFEVKPSVDLRLSPNGEMYVKAKVSKESSSLDIFSSSTLASLNAIDLSKIFDENTILRSIRWLDNKHVAAVLIDKEEVENTLLERNAQTRLIIIDVSADINKPLIYEVSTKGVLIEAAPNQDNVFYFARNGRKSKVYKIDITKLLKLNQKRSKLTRVDGGQFVARNVVAQTDGYAIKWFFEHSGAPNAVVYMDKNQKMNLAVFESDSSSEQGNKTQTNLKTIKTWEDEAFDDDKSEKKPLYLPIAKAPDGNAFYATDFHEEQNLNLYLVDYQNDTHEQIYSSPGFPIKDIVFSREDKAIGVVVLEEGLYTTHFFDGQPIRNEADTLNVVAHESTNGDVKLLYTEAHNISGRYLIQIKDKPPVLVHENFPALPDKLPTVQVKDVVNVYGANIPYLLTLPENASNKQPAALIVMPHGGPFNVFDTPYFDNITQFFAANNYAVLRVNFRGSGGYGIEHRDAGKKQWGTTLIDDISGAIAKVRKRDDIDKARLCSVGLSYGGYASVVLNLQYPQWFKCAVSVAGVSDMNLFLNQPHISDAQAKWLKDYVGDVNQDRQALYDISPLYKMHQFSRPLLLIHGAKDERVLAEHSFRIKLVLEKANIPFEWRLYEQADHHFAQKGQSIKLFSDILGFVDKHLKQD